MIYHQVIFIPLRQEIHKEVTKKKKHNMENSSKPILCTIGIGHCQSHIGSKRSKIPLRKLFLKWFRNLHFFMLEVFATTLRISNFLTFSKWSMHLTKKMVQLRIWKIHQSQHCAQLASAVVSRILGQKEAKVHWGISSCFCWVHLLLQSEIYYSNCPFFCSPGPSEHFQIKWG